MSLIAHAASTDDSESGQAQKQITITGTVFNDYNQNGIQDANEPGVNNVVVSLYSATNELIATRRTGQGSNDIGTYQFVIPLQKQGARIQFSNIGATSTDPRLRDFEPSNHKSGTMVTFIDGQHSLSGIDLGIEQPRDYCQNNPQLVASCYIRGAQTGSAPVIVKFPYTANDRKPAPQAVTSESQVGSTWGLAYQASSDSLFAAAYIKRHTGLKIGGSTGAIYLLSGVRAATGRVTASLFVDLNAVFGPDTAGANPHDQNNYDLDAAAYDAIGKVGLGGLAISDDQTTLYTVNLADRQLYRIPLGPSLATPQAGVITRTPIPAAGDCAKSDFRPFAVTAYLGAIYVGAVCSAESTVTPGNPRGDPKALRAYVFLYKPDTGFTATPVFQFPLNYPRHCATSTLQPQCLHNAPAAWNPWHPGYAESVRTVFTTYPQPMFTSIAFDNGNMLIGLRDRYGDQLGYNNLTPDGTRRVSGITAGDLLRACLKKRSDLSQGWLLEQNGSCGGRHTAGVNNGKGPGGGEYYDQDTFLPYHDHVSMGSILQIPGVGDVIDAVFDPLRVDTGGIRRYNNRTGVRDSTYQLYDRSIPGEFNKANGLGAIIALCQSAPIEIRTRVWLDSNGDGLQEPNEPGLRNVTVRLYESNGHSIHAKAQTDAQGDVYFSVAPYKRYILRLDNPDDYRHGSLRGKQLTAGERDKQYHDDDSKGILPHPGKGIQQDNYPEIILAAHNPGENDESQNLGFKPTGKTDHVQLPDQRQLFMGQSREGLTAWQQRGIAAARAQDQMISVLSIKEADRRKNFF